jgi:hypothetical protein
MTSIAFNDQELIITIIGLDKLLAFKGEVKIKLAHIESVALNHEGLMAFKNATSGIGTIFANRIQAGTFKEGGNKSFWDVHDIKKTILLTLSDDKYSKIIIEVENPEETVKAIKDKLVEVAT